MKRKKQASTVFLLELCKDLKTWRRCEGRIKPWEIYYSGNWYSKVSQENRKRNKKDKMRGGKEQCFRSQGKNSKFAFKQ
jgi:hypothetical protein